MSDGFMINDSLYADNGIRLNLKSGETTYVPPELQVLHGGFDNLPEGVARTALSTLEAAEYIRVNASQPFDTGLGEEFEQYMQTAGVGADLITVEPGHLALMPVIWGVTLGGGNRIATGQIIHLGQGAELTLIILEISADQDRQAGGFLGVSTRIILEEGAHLHLVNLQMLGCAAVCMNDIGTSQAAGSGMKITNLQLGGGKLSFGVHADLAGDGAVYDDCTGYMALRDCRLDLNTCCIQRAANSKSMVKHQGVLSGTSQKTMHFTANLANGSGGSSVNEEENIILLSEEAVNCSVPDIISEDENTDVSHCEYAGSPDQCRMFYLNSRGIRENTAKRMLVDAKIMAVAERIPDKRVTELVKKYVEETLDTEAVFPEMM